MIIWICGISGSGKTTIGQQLANLRRSQGEGAVLVDGDIVRSIVGFEDRADTYDVQGRRRNAEIVEKLVAWLDDQSLTVIVALQSIFQDLLDSHRTTFKSYFEVHLDASLALVQSRDPKGLHGKALADGGSNVVGYGIPYMRPSGSDLYIDMDKDGRSAAEMAECIDHLARLGSGA